MTTIEDVLTYIDGSKANGRLVVGWKPFTVGNVNAAGGELEWQIVEGAVSISLYANTGAQPTGSYYVVKYELENGAVYLEQWIVPDLPSVNLGQVRVAFPPSPSVMISPLQLTSLGAAPGMFLMWNGQRWVPGYPGTFSFVDPTLVKGDMIVRGDVAPATRLGVGLDGWTLIADSSQPLGIKWIAPISGFADPTTTKGDLIVRGGSGTTRIGVGTNAQVLTVDTAQSLGVKWAAVPVTPPTALTPWTQDIDGAGFRLINTSAIGIGTASPGGPLEVWQAVSNGRVNVTFLNNGAAGAGSRMRLRLGAWTGFAGTDLYPYVESYNDTADGAQVGLAFGTYAGASLERMRITSAGNVGIGTTGPSVLLSTGAAVAPIKIAVFDQGTGLNCYGIGIGSGMLTFGAAISVTSGIPQMVLTSAGNVGIGTTGPTASMHLARGDGSYHLKLLANGIREYGLAVTGAGFLTLDDVTGGAIRMMINPSGNIGIGGSPGYKLDVAGDVNCSGVFRRNGIACGTPSGFYNQTGARALNTAYQNTTGMPIFVNVITSVNASQYMQVLTDIANPPTTVISVASNGAGVSATLTVSGWVMPGHYYKVFHSGGSLTSWIEWF